MTPRNLQTPNELKTENITARVALKESILQVMLESTQLPDQETLPSVIHKGVASLNVVSIEKLKVYGRKAGEDRPAWSKEFDLSKQAETVMAEAPNIPNSSQVANTKKSKVQAAAQANVQEKSSSSSSASKIRNEKSGERNQASPAPEASATQKGFLGCFGISFLLIAGLYILGLVVGDQSSPTLSSSSVQSNPPSASECEQAMKIAADIPDMQDTVEDIDPVIRTCVSMAEFISASSKFPIALNGTDEATFISNRCAGNSSLKNTSICKELLPTLATIHYLAVNSESSIPSSPVPVSDQATMQSLITAAQSKDRKKYESIATSSSVVLIPGGAKIDVVGTSGDFIQVKLYGRDAEGNDLSGQVRWTHSKFVQSRQMKL